MVDKIKVLKWWHHKLTDEQRDEFVLEYSKKISVGLTQHSILMYEIIEIYKENEESNS